ncbi:hypothetical protein RND81_09G120000 [Saponaria officinalis]|uniref:gibberellin 3beta-dioxygenase n=1 Tax=Saponaria officinalis TaxID=3572 RepID=A0AAW1IJN4_SAPOF
MPSLRLDSVTSSSVNNSVIDLNSIEELPDSYAWIPSYDDSNPITRAGQESIPVIDLDDRNAQQLIGLACKSWGVFQVINHGIHKNLLDNIEDACKKLFGLPAQQKHKAARSPNGVTGYGPARISSFFQKKLWSEGFTIFGSPLEHASQLWPNDYQTFCDIIEEYQKEMKELAKKLTHLILGSLGISNEDIKCSNNNNNNHNDNNINNINDINIFKGASGAIQLNSYPICPDPNRAMGLAAHTDSTLFTILYQNNTSGLQVYQPENGWVTAHPVENGLVINIGDLMQILSNGSYPSVYHQAVVNKARHRYSVAYLYGPPSGAAIQPISELVGPTHPPLYRAVTWSEYLGLKGKYFHKALSLVQLSNNEINIEGPKTSNEPENIKFDSESKVLAAFG